MSRPLSKRPVKEKRSFSMTEQPMIVSEN